MDIDSAISRYTANPDVARWLFSTDEVRTVSATALDNSFVYAIGFGLYDATTPRTMNIEDMLILTGQVGNFLLGCVWGLSQPHVFARTPLMLDKKPVARRFAVDFSARDALEFMEFVSFDDGKVIVMFRQFLHTNDLSLPVIACARLHAASQIEHSLGPILMRADLFEAPRCPACGLVGRRCRCSFDSYAPTGAVRKATYTWNQFASRFMHKARIGTIKMRITAVLPGVGEMRILDDDFPVFNVMQRGQTEYMALLRRKAVHGLGVNVIMPRSEAFVLSTSVENDFIDLHNSYVSRKRERCAQDPSTVLLNPDTVDLTAVQNMSQGTTSGPSYSDSIESVDDVLSIFPGVLSTGESPRHPDNSLSFKHSIACETPIPPVLAPEFPTAFEPFGKLEPPMPPHPVTPNNIIVPNKILEDPQGSPPQIDILNDIELILSPLGSRTDTTQFDTLQPPTPPEPPLGLFSLSPEENNTNLTNRSLTITSDHSTPVVAAQHEASGKGVPAKRKKTKTKRSKPRPESDGSHDSEKKHACNTCSSRFKMRGDLLRHVKIVHEGRKMYSCETCGKAFGHSGHLNRHVSSVHLQKRRFKCQFCGFRFFQQSHLQSHIGHIHGTKKPFSCQECGHCAPSSGALKIHMESSHANPAAITEQYRKVSEGPAGLVEGPISEVGNSFAFDSDVPFQVLSSQQDGLSNNCVESQITALPR